MSRYLRNIRLVLSSGLFIGLFIYTSNATAAWAEIFFDDFDAPYTDAWSLTTSAPYTISQSGSQLRIQVPKPGSGCHGVNLTSKKQFSGEKFKLTVRLRQDGRGLTGVDFGDLPRPRLDFHVNTDDAPWLVLGEAKSGGWFPSILGSSAPFLNKWITMEIQKEGNNYKALVDGVLKKSLTNTVIGNNDLGIRLKVTTCVHKSGPTDSTFDFVRLETEVSEVAVDVKPGSCPNPINLKSKGVLPVAILGTYDLDVSDIDVASVRLAGIAPLRSAIEDVATPYEPFTGKTSATDCNEYGSDNHPDMTLKFDKRTVLEAVEEELGHDLEDGEVLNLQLVGNLQDGTPIGGEDVVIVTRKGKTQ